MVPAGESPLRSLVPAGESPHVTNSWNNLNAMTEISKKTDVPELKVESKQLELVAAPEVAQKQLPAAQPVKGAAYEPLGPWYKQIKMWLFQEFWWDASAIIAPLTPWHTNSGAGVLMGTLMGFMALWILIRFMRRALSNMESYRVPGNEYWPPDAATCWFWPIANLWEPRNVMLEIWRGSDPREENLGEPASPSDVRRIRRWWIPAVIGYFGCWIPFALAFMFSTDTGQNLMLLPKASTTALIYWAVVFCFRLFAAVQLNGILKEITHRQMHKLGTDANQMIT
jgi:hypothetical protein